MIHSVLEKSVDCDSQYSCTVCVALVCICRYLASGFYVKIIMSRKYAYTCLLVRMENFFSIYRYARVAFLYLLKRG